MNYVKNNLKFLRKKEALTQEQLATKIGVKRAMIGAYEEGRAEPRLHTLQHLAAYFQVRLDDFVNKDLSGSGSIPKADVSGAQLRILPVIVDGTEEKELGTLVPVKASAGYLSGYGDADYIGALPRFSMPFPELQIKTQYISEQAHMNLTSKRFQLLVYHYKGMKQMLYLMALDQLMI